MKRILFLLFAIGLGAGMTVMAGMSTSKIRKETRFLTDKMAYELNLTTQQYNDAYEINYDFIYSVRNIMDYVARGYEWAMDDYYEALDIRNDDLRWVLSDGQYRRFMGADYFYRPIYVTGGRWSLRVYINYPNRGLFYFGVPYHYHTYCGAHYRPHIHHTSYYRGRYNHFHHYSTPHRVRDQRVYHSYRRSDFGSVRIRPNSSVRPHNAPTRPGNSYRPGTTTRPGSNVAPDKNRNRNANRVGSDRNSGCRPETGPGSSSSNRRSTSGSSTGFSSSNRENGKTSSSSRGSSSRRNDSSSYNRNNSSERNNSSSSSRRGSSSRSSSSRSDSGRTRSTRSNVSSGQTERRSSSGSTRSNSTQSSSRSSERNSSGSRR